MLPYFSARQWKYDEASWNGRTLAMEAHPPGGEAWGGPPPAYGGRASAPGGPTLHGGWASMHGCCCCYQFIFWIEHSISRKKISSKCPILLNSKIELIGNYWWNKANEIFDSSIKHDLRQSLCNWRNIQISTGRYQISRQSDKCSNRWRQLF